MTKTIPTPITDFHAHIFARPFFDALASQSPLPGPVEQKLRDVTGRMGIELPEPGIDAHLERWVGQLDEHGVTRLAAFASAPEEIQTVGEMAARSKGRLVPIAVCNPAAPGAAERLRPLLEERGFRGVLLFPAMHHYHLSDDAVRPVLDLLEEHEAIAYVHCGILVIKLRDLLGLPRPYDLRYANPLEVIPAACAHPGLTFCIPHFGAGFFRETLIAGAQCSNVITDTSSTNGWVKTQPDHPSLTSVLERALDVFGVDRVAFGTDSNVFPQGWRSERLTEWRQVAAELGLSEAECVQLFHGTADRLLGATRTVQHAT
ncbi:Amidohydrolase [Planctomycetes bacterium Poly30]|uniref:Amidohydrolase n=1 Tax=Saltatorellus ferox TaxID=2528018 RepID=A0A518ESD8_9BACT|nr:Amidohydrolase [Planctomycetes bacterium Poly30]